MSNRMKLLAGAVSLTALAFALPASASPNGVKIGVLTCHVESGWGYVLGSSRDVHCNYHPDRGVDDLVSQPRGPAVGEREVSVHKSEAGTRGTLF